MRLYAEDAIMKKWIVANLLGITVLNASSQPIGQWTSHFSYAEARELLEVNDRIYCATALGLFSVDTSTGNLITLDKTNGLSDVGVSVMAYTPEAEVLLLAYSSGLIEGVPVSGATFVFSDLTLPELNESINFYDLDVRGSMAFLSTSVGVVTLDLVQRVLRENYRNIGPEGLAVEVFSTAVSTTAIHVRSSVGLLSASLDDNLLDFNNWTVQDSTTNWSALGSHEEVFYAVANGDSLFQFDGDDWTPNAISYASYVNRLEINANGQLIAIAADQVFDALSGEAMFISEGLSGIRDAIFLNERWYVADNERGLVMVNGVTQESLRPNGPLSNFPSLLKYLPTGTFSLYGHPAMNTEGPVDSLGYSFYAAGRWTNEMLPDFFNLSDVTFFEGNHYFSSYLFGVRNAETGRQWTSTDSALPADVLGWTAVSRLTADASSIWIGMKSGSPNVLRMNQLAVEQITPIASGAVADFKLTGTGTLWAVINERPFSRTETGSIGIGLPVSTFLTGSLALTRGDVLWAASNRGPKFYTNASFPLDDTDLQTPLIDGGALLGNETINDVMLDGGDRLWVATETGVWVFEDSFGELVQRFTKDNSPLPSDSVNELSYESATGTVFMATAMGMVSYRSGSSQPESALNKIRVFPNPVNPAFDGTVAISGLVDDAELRLTDINGRLVNRLKSVGGTATWNLLDINGQQIATGVYLVFATSRDGKSGIVGKIVVVR